MTNLEQALNALDVLVTFLLIIHMASTFAELAHQGQEAELALGLGSSLPWEHATYVYKTVEHVVNGIFLIELLLRIILMHAKFFLHAVNIFDTVVMILTSIQLYGLTPLSSVGDMKLLRIG